MRLTDRLLSVLVLVTALIASSALVVEPAAAAERRALSNGCTATKRGVPGCGAYVGGGYGANDGVRSWERTLGRKLGVRRTFWQAGQISGALHTARVDTRHHRLPWLSFKAPYSWAEMAAGRGDAWAKSMAAQLATVPGPVWVAVHHEPENDRGDIQQWKTMQERIGPIIRRTAPNVGFTVILMGYHQFYGDQRFRLSAMWPNTKVDVAGFDIYEQYGTNDGGNRVRREWTWFGRKYFGPISRWAARQGVAWAIAETGYNDVAAAERPNWPRRTYRKLKRYGGVAFSYFNSPLNSKTNWTLSSQTKMTAFARINRRAVRLR